MLNRLRQGLGKARESMASGLRSALGRESGEVTASWDDLEETLLATDLGPTLALDVVANLREQFPKTFPNGETLHQSLKSILLPFFPLEPPDPFFSNSPWVVSVVGVNGAGKTTTIGKLAAQWTAKGHRGLLAAADTFRAAAKEQLSLWADLAGCEMVSGAEGADPAAVAHDALNAAKARKMDFVLVDTAGRLHARQNLMAELSKIQRVMGGAIPGAPHRTFLVLDGTQGQNALPQAHAFAEAGGVTDLILTKMDGTARGGAAVAVARELQIPLTFIGVGEQVEDLLPFEPESFLEHLLPK